MGTIVKLRDLPSLQRGGLQLPVIYCNPDAQLMETSVSISVQLATKLASVKPTRRAMRLEQFFLQVLMSLSENPVIRDFDVMFNPEYEVDVLRIMCSAARTKPFSAVWPGKYEDGRLIYAEDGYADYKAFDIKQYDVTCVI